jgi:hypothetical protein
MNGENDEPFLEALLNIHGGVLGQLRNIAAMEEITPAVLTFNNFGGVHIPP